MRRKTPRQRKADRKKALRKLLERAEKDPDAVVADVVEFVQDWDNRLEDAGGDVIEALHGHKCGPDCWHKARPKPPTPEEIKADVKGASRRVSRDMGAQARRDLISAGARWIRQRFL
jgi:hypothetical protein